MFPGLQPSCCSCPVVPVWVSFAWRMGFLSVGNNSWAQSRGMRLRSQALPTDLHLWGSQMKSGSQAPLTPEASRQHRPAKGPVGEGTRRPGRTLAPTLSPEHCSILIHSQDQSPLLKKHPQLSLGRPQNPEMLQVLPEVTQSLRQIGGSKRPEGTRSSLSSAKPQSQQAVPTWSGPSGRGWSP